MNESQRKILQRAFFVAAGVCGPFALFVAMDAMRWSEQKVFLTSLAIAFVSLVAGLLVGAGGKKDKEG